ncbi:hypothetical protein T08_9389 [Trichinella sp. T8]|nr:hypothetical protein T08_9389 [Trichinella sp. T8]
MIIRERQKRSSSAYLILLFINGGACGREGRVQLVNVGFWTNRPPTPLLKQSSSLCNALRNANVKPKCVHLTKQRIVGLLKLSFALDYRLMTKNVASFGASTFLTVTCTREQQSHATDEEAHCRHRRLIIVTFDLCQSCSSQAHYPAASFDLCIC